MEGDDHVSLYKADSNNILPIGSKEEIRNLLAQANSREILDVLHLLRIEYAEELFRLSLETLRSYEEKLRNVIDRAGVYLIVIVNPEGNVILYAGKTSGKSKTSGLRFRVRDHVRILAKTPLTLFIPNWWVKRIYPIHMEEKEKAKRLEKRLWTFMDKHAMNKSRFVSLDELEKELSKVINKCVELPDEIRFVELQPSLNPKSNFILEKPPAGRPRGLRVEVSEKC